MCAEAEERSSFLYESCQSDFTDFSLWNWLTCLWVKDFNVNVVVKNVDCIFAWYVDTDSWTVTFCKSLDVEEFNSKNTLDSVAPLFAPAF